MEYDLSLLQNPAPANPASGTVITSMTVNYSSIAPQHMSDPAFVLRAFPIKTKAVHDALAQQFPDALNISVIPKSIPEITEKGYAIHHQLFAVVGFPTLAQAELHKDAIRQAIEKFNPNRAIEQTEPTWTTRAITADVKLAALPCR